MDELFKCNSEYIKIFVGTTSETDPYEHTIEETLMNPIPIKAIVTDLTSTQMNWKTAGIITSKAKEIIIKKKHEDMLKMSRKIEINNEDYYGWKTNGQLNYRVEGNYLRCYVYIKKED